MSKFDVNDAKRLIGKMQLNYGKKFADQWIGVNPEDLALEMVNQYQDLNTNDFIRGIERMKKEKWPPSIPEFRQWCLQEGATYKAKFAALANIEAWLSDSTTTITNAEKQAYDAVYEMFNQMKWASNYEKQKYYAYEAFKDTYTEVVKDLTAQGIPQHIWEPPVAIERPVEPVAKSKRSYIDDPDTKWIKERTAKLVEGGMSFPSAMLQATKERNSK